MTPKQRQQATDLSDRWARQYRDANGDRAFIGAEAFLTLTTIGKDSLGLRLDIVTSAAKAALQRITAAEEAHG